MEKIKGHPMPPPKKSLPLAKNNKICNNPYLWPSSIPNNFHTVPKCCISLLYKMWNLNILATIYADRIQWPYLITLISSTELWTNTQLHNWSFSEKRKWLGCCFTKVCGRNIPPAWYVNSQLQGLYQPSFFEVALCVGFYPSGELSIFYLLGNPSRVQRW